MLKENAMAKTDHTKIYLPPHTDMPPIPVGYRRFVVTHVNKGNGNPARENGWTLDAPSDNSDVHDAARLWYDDTDQSEDAQINIRQIEASGKAVDYCIKLCVVVNATTEWRSPVPSPFQDAQRKRPYKKAVRG